MKLRVALSRRLQIAIFAIALCGIALTSVAADTQTKKGTSVVNNKAAPKVIDEENIEVDQWPFTIRTLQTPDKYVVMSFLRNMPVSHEYVIDTKTYQTQKASGLDPLKQAKELARKDLKAGLYRTWVIHWASQ